MSDPTGDEILLTDAEAAKLLRIIRARLVKFARAGLAPCVMLPDGEIRFRRSDLVDFAASCYQPVQSQGAAR